MTPIILKCTDRYHNVAFITLNGAYATCQLSSGIPASLSYAGVPSDKIAEAGIMFGRCTSPEAALIMAERYILQPTTFEVF